MKPGSKDIRDFYSKIFNYQRLIIKMIIKKSTPYPSFK